MSSKILIAGAALLLSACTTANQPISSGDVGLGEAVRYNAAVQTINPAPVYAQGGALPGSLGDKGAAAVERYRTDKVSSRHTSEASSLESSGLSTTQGTSSGSGPR